MRHIRFYLLLTILIILSGKLEAQISLQDTIKDKNGLESNDLKTVTHKYKVTFIELGSVKCIPCQKMQLVMKSVEKNYGDEVKIVFYDVWTKEGKPFAELYKINAIPTQIFLDDKGVEYFRHEGYFEEKELIEVLKQKGVKKS